MKLTPRSMARWRAASDVLSSVEPQSLPPMPYAPNPMAEMFQPVRPKVRYCIWDTWDGWDRGFVEMGRDSTSRVEVGDFGESLAGSCSDAGNGGGSGTVGTGATVGTGVCGGVACATACSGSTGTLATVGTGGSAGGALV